VARQAAKKMIYEHLRKGLRGQLDEPISTTLSGNCKVDLKKARVRMAGAGESQLLVAEALSVYVHAEARQAEQARQAQST